MIFNLSHKKLLIFAVVGAIVVVTVTLGLYFGLRSPATTNHRYGGVASNGHECAEIGVNVLKQQGSAVDAAIAVLFCENVAVPQSMGLGGGFLMNVYDKKTQHVESLIAREVAPIHATADMFVDKNQASVVGGLAVAVPGELKGYWEAHQKYGKLSWRKLIEPSIELCKRGSKVSKNIAAVLKSQETKILVEPSLREVFINPHTSKVWVEGDLMPRPKLAETMETIAREGASALYSKGGALLHPLLDDITAFGGILTEEDFLTYTVRWETPIKLKLIDDMTLYTIPLPGSGLVLSFILHVLSHFQLDHSGLSWHRVIEAFKFAYAKRSNLGDPAFVEGIEAIIADMNSADHIQEVWSQIDDTKTFNDPMHYGANYSVVPDRGTAHIAIISPNGDAVSVTSTINDYFGAFRRSPKTGIILNNEMDDFSTPGLVNLYGVPASHSNYIVPGKRPMSSMSPSIIVDRNGDAQLVIGGAGGTKITSSVAYTIIRHLYLNESISTALGALRLHHQLAPMVIEHEENFDTAILSELEKRGHVLKVIPKDDGFAALQAIARENDGSLTSVNDHRRGGSAIVFAEEQKCNELE